MELLGIIISSSAGVVSSRVVFSFFCKLVRGLTGKFKGIREAVNMTNIMGPAQKAIRLESGTFRQMFEGMASSIAAASLAT